jgi:hypothetical protein
MYVLLPRLGSNSYCLALYVDDKEWSRGRGHGQGATPRTMVTASKTMGYLSIEAHVFALWL